MKPLYTFWCLIIFCGSFISCTINSTTKRTIDDDDYYINYDYELTNNNKSKIFIKPESLILPNPENIESKYTVDILPNVELPDDSLADTDLRDHDFIDNLMYVYYGSHNKNTKNYGPEIIIIGSVLTCAAHLLTIFVALLRRNVAAKREVQYVFFLHLMAVLFFSNLMFMLGVYPTKNESTCQLVGFLLYYLHLLSAYWIFLFCYYVHQRFCDDDLPSTRFFVASSFIVPGMTAMVSFLVSPMSYETKRFCFISVQKGMMTNYMMPVSILIIATTVYAINGIRKVNLELSKLELTTSAESLNALRHEIDPNEEKKLDCSDEEIKSLRETKRCLKTLCIVETCYDMVWFFAVVALENINSNNSMAIIYSISSCLLNWYIFARMKWFLPTILTRSNLVDDNMIRQDHEKGLHSNAVMVSRCGSSDNIPLLVNSDTEMREIARHDYISTIST